MDESHSDHDPEFDALTRRLEDDRPIPSAGFRGELRRSLIARMEADRFAGARLRRLIFAYATSGAALLAVAAIGLVGAGPFAA